MAKSANEVLLDATIKHQIRLLRFSDREAAEAAKLLRQSDAELVALLQAQPTEAAEARLNALLTEIRRMRAAAIASIGGQLRQDMPELAGTEANWEVAAIQAAVPVEVALASVPAATLRALVNSPINGVPLEGWLGQLATRDVQRIEQQLRLGVLAGDTNDEMVRRIRGTRANNFQDGVTAITRRDAETIVRTTVNHVSTEARQATWDANADIIDGVRWVATLDGRTSPVCRSRDGEVYPIDKGPRPPAHPNCRSTVVPVLKGEAIVGDRPSVTDTRTRRQRDIDFRAEAREEAGESWAKMSVKQRDAAIREKRNQWTQDNISRVPDNVTYQSWLKDQGAKFQDDVLGPTRGRLFREGVQLDRFVDASGRQYNLDQLRGHLDGDMRDLLDRLRDQD